MGLIQLLKANNWNDLKCIPQEEVENTIKKNNDDYLKTVINICIKNRNTKYLHLIVFKFEQRISDEYFAKIVKYSLDIEFNLSEEMLMMINNKYKNRISKRRINEVDKVIAKIVAEKLRGK